MLPKLIILKHHPQTYLLADVVELDEEPALLLQDCCTVTENGIEAYPKYTLQRDVFLTTSDVMTIIDPSPSVAKEYLTVLESLKKPSVSNE